MWIILTAIFFILLYFTGIKPLFYWKNLDVPSIRAWPYFGHLASYALRIDPFVAVIERNYYAFPDNRYFGFYNMSSPTLMIRDPELIKRITVKEFDTFPEHRSFIPDDVDPLWNNNLFAIKGGEKWSTIRSTLSPSFTSSKIKMMFKLMKECAEQFSQYYLKQDGSVTIEIKDAFSRFTNDVIATTAFGVNCNSLESKENEFYLMGRRISDFTGIRNLALMLHNISPTIIKILRIPLFDKSVGQFFRNLVKETIRIREEREIVRPDMIHLLMETRKNEKMNKSQKSNKIAVLTDDDITSQVLAFFLAGFDSVSTMMCFAAYELALNLHIQEKLRKEVDEAFERTNGNITYEAITGLKYLDMVITETLRKWPPINLSDRRSVKTFTIEPEKSWEKPLHLPAGSTIHIPIYSIHRDPKNFPNPDKFDPERFSDENKDKIKPYTFLAFGSGPRNCIGARFAILEGKLVIAEIVRKFKIITVSKTPIPLVMTKEDDVLLPEDGFWLGLEPRN